MTLDAAHPSRFWSDLKSPDFARLDLARCIAVLPVAAIEQHGPHLPLNVDQALVDGVVEATLPHLPTAQPVLFSPTQSVGFSPEHTRFPGTLTLKADTVIRLWTELAESVAQTGVKKLVLLNSHGGQVGLLDPAGSATLLYSMSEEGRGGKQAFLEKRLPDSSKFSRVP